MERKTKHRILGLLVIVGAAIILFPFFQFRKDFSPSAAVVKAPPFPEQNTQVAAIAQDDEAVNPPSVQPVAANAPNPDMPVGSATQQPASNTIAVNSQPSLDPQSQSAIDKQLGSTPVAQNTQNTQAAAPVASPVVAANTSPSTENVAAPTPTVVELHLQPQSQSPLQPVATTPTAAATNVNQPIHKAVHAAKKHSHPARIYSRRVSKQALHAPIIDNGLASIKNPAWVIQVGSYQNKTTALREVNRLRLKGYPTFIQHVDGESTRVFVGPTKQRTAAYQLATELKTNMHVQGIVISYKPLSL